MASAAAGRWGSHRSSAGSEPADNPGGAPGISRRPELKRAGSVAVLTHLLHEAQGEAGDQEAAGKLPSGYRKTLLLAVLGLVWYVLVFIALIFLLLSITQDRDASSVVEPVRKLLGAYDDKTLAAVTGPDSFLSWIETGLLPSLGPRVGAECGLTVDTPLPPSSPSPRAAMSRSLIAAMIRRKVESRSAARSRIACFSALLMSSLSAILLANCCQT